MNKIGLALAIALTFSLQNAHAQTGHIEPAKCVPPSNPTVSQLREGLECLQNVLNKLIAQPVNPPPQMTDANAVHWNDPVALQFKDVQWCVARGDPGDNRMYTLQCSEGAPNSGVAHMSIQKAR